MFKTPIGLFNIKKNGNNIPFSMDILNTNFLNFTVDGRYQTNLSNLGKDAVLDFYLETRYNIEVEDRDSDERLFLTMFSLNNFYFGIGVDGDIAGIKYEYLNNGIRLIISEPAVDSINVNIAWKKGLDEKHLLDVWYGVDPEIR
ncbi:MAG: hypothetical protein P1P64_01305 [Treponemataceae bacterium]